MRFSLKTVWEERAMPIGSLCTDLHEYFGEMSSPVPPGAH